VAGREFEEYLIDTSRLFLHHRLLSQSAFQAEEILIEKIHELAA
jgi:hypothetical protein